eukprot:scaffold1062_cov130-Cylindrotheca_fusiformis.AAC.46
MLRPRGAAKNFLPSTSSHNIHDNDQQQEYQASKSARHKFLFQRAKKLVPLVLGMTIFMGLLMQSFLPVDTAAVVSSMASTSTRISSNDLKEFQGMIERAKKSQAHCQSIPNSAASEIDKNKNNHTVHLPQFGFLKAVQNYNPQTSDYPYTCQLPPETECEERQFTVIFMAYNPDRLEKLYNQILKMVTDKEFKPLIAEVVVVWNGERHVDETGKGKALIDLTKTLPVRISYPLKAGFPNDLMNRYHPRLDIQTKAIMYYDDDGPFYSYKATLGGFELWKRNANAQIGAMARKLDYSKRQLEEKKELLQTTTKADRFFVSHCPTDELTYNYFEFANFGANMVLPSGSFLHANYLCFLWHPLFEEIREYVQQHRVHPDDGTVSAIVSHLGGRAPKVYSRRINESKGDDPPRRRLMKLNENDKAIDWDNPGNHDTKMFWAKLRSDAANSLIRYFGSINSGSLGWCHETPWQKGPYCKPEMAKVGYLPWMNDDHTPKSTCP